MRPIDVLHTAVASFEPFLQPSGEMFDPVYMEPTQYGTAYHMYCQMVLAVKGRESERAAHLERAVRGLDACITYVADPSLPVRASSMDRVTGKVWGVNHRDFFWPAMLKAYGILKELGHERVEEFARRLAQVDIMKSFRARPPSNWAMVWVSGEWLRICEGLSPYTKADYDAWLEQYFAEHVIMEMGLYQEPGHPNSYDLFTRVHMADVLAAGYDGKMLPQMEQLMETGLKRSLAVQLSDGSLGSGFRSTGMTWTLGAQCAYFTRAANWFAGRDAVLAAEAWKGAQRAFASFARFQRAGSYYSPVENLLPPTYRVGYEDYTADGHYSNLAMGFMAGAIYSGYDRDTETVVVDESPRVLVEQDPTYRAVAHAGRYSVTVNAFPTPHYDGWGLVDLTFGPNRMFQLTSSAKHLSAAETWYNLGMAVRFEPGRSELTVMANQDARPIGPITRGDSPASVRVKARVKGSPFTNTLAVDVTSTGVTVAEATPGMVTYKTLLVPYLRDCGNGQITSVTRDGNTFRFQLGAEVVRLTVDDEIDHVIDLLHGYENRRGLCGLLRIDLAKPCEGIRYTVVCEA